LQAAVRATLSTASQLWTTLTQETQTDWVDAAPQEKNRLGELRSLTGNQYFVRVVGGRLRSNPSGTVDLSIPTSNWLVPNFTGRSVTLAVDVYVVQADTVNLNNAGRDWRLHTAAACSFYLSDVTLSGNDVGSAVNIDNVIGGTTIAPIEAVEVALPTSWDRNPLANTFYLYARVSGGENNPSPLTVFAVLGRNTTTGVWSLIANA
jgi:hypothetical protein